MFWFILVAGPVLLSLLGIKIASKIEGTRENLLIAFCILLLSVVGMTTFSFQSHSLLMLTLALVSHASAFLLVGVCIRLTRKLLWG